MVWRLSKLNIYMGDICKCRSKFDIIYAYRGGKKDEIKKGVKFCFVFFGEKPPRFLKPMKFSI